MPIKLKDFIVHVYSHSGWIDTKIRVRACDVASAKEKAKKEIYRRGHSAHFYTYVAGEVENDA